jgi:hypothetical protein
MDVLLQVSLRIAHFSILQKRVNSAKNREESKRFQERLQKRREEAKQEKSSVSG